MQPKVSIFPVSFSQRRLWFLSQLEPDSAAYNVANALRLSGPLDADALEQSIQGIINRHETLRTTFSIVEGQPHQIIARRGQAQLDLIDLRRLPPVEREAEARQMASREAHRPVTESRLGVNELGLRAVQKLMDAAPQDEKRQLGRKERIGQEIIGHAIRFF